MAQIKIVQFSEIGTHCISTFRQFEHCYECNSVYSCKLPEAKIGRIKLAEIRFLKAKLIFEQRKAEYDKAIEENT